jgi:hypothetical protein
MEPSSCSRGMTRDATFGIAFIVDSAHHTGPWRRWRIDVIGRNAMIGDRSHAAHRD